MYVLLENIKILAEDTLFFFKREYEEMQMDSLCVILNVLAASVTLINPFQAASELCARFHVLFDGFV